MKLAIIRQQYRPDGGAERFISRALAGLSDTDLDVSIITRQWNDGGQHRILLCNPTKGLFRTSREKRFNAAAKAILNTENFDLVQSHERIPGCDIYRAGDGVHAEWLAQRRRLLSPLARLLQQLSIYHRYMCNNEKALFEHPKLRAVICNSDMVRQEISQRFAIAPEKLHLIYNGVNTEQFNPELKAQFRDSIRAQLGIDNTTTVAIFVGSGFERKGLTGALHAIAKGSATAHLLVVGGDKKIAHYQKLSHTLGIADRVHWLGVQQDVKPWYGAADLLLLPTVYDPFPNVVFEAMATGLAIITSNKCGGAELTHDNGLVCDALDYEALANALTHLDKPEICHHKGLESRRIAEQLKQQDMIQQLISLYQTLLKQ